VGINSSDQFQILNSHPRHRKDKLAELALPYTRKF